VLVFKNNDNKLILKFVAVYAVICSLGILILRVADLYNINLYLAGIFSTGLSAAVSYVLNKEWVFK
jgi:putative flippase GtrA